MGTYFAKTRLGKISWRVLDADGWALGRLASQAAVVLMGKNSPTYTPHTDHRDGVIVINAAKIRLTGKKLDDKMYRRYTGYPGGLREISARRYMETRPDRVIREAIVGMLPKTRLGNRLARRIKVYAGTEHPHQAQKPAPLSPKP